MDKATVLRVVSDFGKALEEANIRPQRIILFGSFSRGTPRPDSDIDLVVVYARDGEVVYSSAAP
ncbi:MAG TPA: nucleotidyltransferase domain-containing protein [Sedimentisphaerales bacterium]|jgi:predicted nucleotidyltransferase|nr:nucleotidyltransferase domain-containing protein [Sedimentisphaerales bacterium]